MNLLSIDPSIRSLGLAVFDESGAVTKIASLKLSNGHEDDYVIRAVAMARSIVPYVMDGDWSVVTETPAHWSHARGTNSESSESVQKLYWFVGTLVGHLIDLPQVKDIYTVKPAQWKGTVPKAVMTARARKMFPTLPIDSFPHDTHEALILGSWARRKIESGNSHPLVPVKSSVLSIQAPDIKEYP
jgi:hypothetical protein